MTWMLSAYQNLGRKYRKGIKKLFIVHSGTWTRIVLEVAGRVVSPKFARKIKYTGTLSELAEHIPLTQVIPLLKVVVEGRLIFLRRCMLVICYMRVRLYYLRSMILSGRNYLERIYLRLWDQMGLGDSLESSSMQLIICELKVSSCF